MDATQPARASYWRQQIEKALLAPIRAMRLSYLPLLMVYFAYGATGLVGVAETFWIRKSLTWSPAELAALSVWFSLPWTIKMVFGELVDTVPLLGSQRRVYVFGIDSNGRSVLLFPLSNVLNRVPYEPRCDRSFRTLAEFTPAASARVSEETVVAPPSAMSTRARR